ncbi:PEP-CTERM sorting domain-containing protein, partial [Glaciimonas sp. CA11.2]
STEGFDNVRVSAVPEPTSLALLGLGILGFVASRRKATKHTRG